MELYLSKGQVSINVDKILFFCKAKKGTSITLDDGTILDIDEPYESFSARLFRHVETVVSQSETP